MDRQEKIKEIKEIMEKLNGVERKCVYWIANHTMEIEKIFNEESKEEELTDLYKKLRDKGEIKLALIALYKAILTREKHP